MEPIIIDTSMAKKIHLCVVKIGKNKYAIISSDVREKYERPDKLIKKMRESRRKWIEDGLKKESGSD